MFDARVVALRSEAQRLASTGAWHSVGALLLDARETISHNLECATLLAEALLRTGKSRQAGEWLQLALPAHEASDDRRHFRRALLLRGAAHFEQGELDDARQAFTRAMEQGREEGDDAVVARAMNNLGAIANIEGKWAEAMALYNLAVSVHQRLGNRLGLAEAFHNMAITYRDLGRLEEADELEQRSVAQARESGEPRMEAHARLGRAEIALRRGDPSWAEASARRVAQDFAAAGDRVRRADALRLAGVACMRLGKREEASALLDEALEQTRALGAMLNAAETLRARAELRLADGDLVATRADAAEALALFQQLGAEGEAGELQLWMRGLATPGSA